MKYEFKKEDAYKDMDSVWSTDLRRWSWGKGAVGSKRPEGRNFTRDTFEEHDCPCGCSVGPHDVLKRHRNVVSLTHMRYISKACNIDLDSDMNDSDMNSNEDSDEPRPKRKF